MAIDTVPPLIAAQISYLTTHCPFPVKVEQMWSGCKNPSLLDRFTLVIPFCLEFVKWDVIYNAMYPLAAPDIIFGPEDEMFQPYFIGTGKSSKNGLANWNSKDPSRLLNLIVELRNAYMAYQRKRIGEVDDGRLKFEISTMLPRQGIEMYISPSTDKLGEARFAIPLLDMDLNKLVVGSTWRQPQKMYLQVVFPVCKKYSTAPPSRLKLISSAELEALFSVEDFKLPTWLDGMCMAEYLPLLEEKLGAQIKEAVASIEVRRTFIIALAPVFGRPIEADPVFCRRATFLTSSGVFNFLILNLLQLWQQMRICWFNNQVHFSISLQFPKQQPAIKLQSSQHFNSQGAPIKSSNITQYPWSPRWRPSQMADRLFEFLTDESLNFKKKCNQLNPQ